MLKIYYSLMTGSDWGVNCSFTLFGGL